MKKEHFKKNTLKQDDTSEENVSEDKKYENEDVSRETSDETPDEATRLKDELLRALAEMENLKKRCATEIEKNNKYAVAAFAKDLLSVADNLQRALSAAESEAENAALLQGVQLTADGLNHVLAKYGVVPMNCIGQIFDPNFHRVVQEVESPDKKNGEIIAELQKGYMISDRLLREAMVVVAKSDKA